jgi:hypothetical protein
MLSRAADLDEFLSHIGEFSNRTIRVEYRVTLRDANKRLSAKTRIAVDGGPWTEDRRPWAVDPS